MTPRSASTILRSRAGLFTLAGVGASSASGLVFEIALIRVFAVTQFYHFAFLTVSIALLGIGAGGSALAAFPTLGAGGPRRWAGLAALQGAATIGAYAFTNRLPFDSFAVAWDPVQILLLAATYPALSVPFFFGGLLVGILLTGAGRPEPVSANAIYAASLVGSGLGCVVAVIGLDLVGGERMVVVAAALAVAGAAGFAAPAERRRRLVSTIVVLSAALVALVVVAPGLLEMSLSPYKALAGALRYPGARIVATDWDRGTRIDFVRSDGIRSLPGLSLTATGVPLTQDGVTFDGDDLSPIPRVAPEQAPFAKHMLTVLPWRLRPGADTLVLEPRGGLDVLIALAGGAAAVTAVEPHGAAVVAIPGGEPGIYDDSRVELVVDDPRAFVDRTGRTFDVVDLALTAPYRPVASGAYSLVEDYRLTVEAFESYLDRLAPGGILTAARWIQTPPSEETRLVGVAAAALRRTGIDPATAIVMLRSYSNALLLVAPDGWSASDLAVVRSFADEQRFDLVAMPGPGPSETNRYNVIPDEAYSGLAAQILTTPDPEALYAGYDLDISPPTDDHPFFGHYFRWGQTSRIVDTLGRTWQPFGGAGFLILVAFAVLATAASLLLIVAPLAIRRRAGPAGAPAAMRWWTLGYFGVLGLAFLMVEIPLIQISILLVGNPTTAFAMVLFAVLVASGAGAAASPRIPWIAGAAVLTLAAFGSPYLVRSLIPVVLSAPLGVRILAGAAAIAPLGFLMGTMFPHGIAHLSERAPGLVPWAWGINGTLSVVATAAAALLALASGFSTVLAAGAAGYAAALALAVVAGLSPRSG